MTGFVRTRPYHRTDVSAPSWSFVRTKTPTCPHFLAPKRPRFPMCDIASVRQKTPTEGNERTEKQNKRKPPRRESRQCVFRESPEKALPGHQSVFWRNEGHSRALRLTNCHIVKMPIPVHFPVTKPSTRRTAIVNYPLSIVNYSAIEPSTRRKAIVNCPLSIVNYSAIEPSTPRTAIVNCPLSIVNYSTIKPSTRRTAIVNCPLSIVN